MMEEYDLEEEVHEDSQTIFEAERDVETIRKDVSRIEHDVEALHYVSAVVSHDVQEPYHDDDPQRLSKSEMYGSRDLFVRSKDCSAMYETYVATDYVVEALSI